MIVIDTAVWADYFNGQQNLHVDRLQTALEREEEIAILPVILTEVLQGFRTEKGFRRAKTLLSRRSILWLSLEGHVRAAQLYRTLRRKGVTVRGPLDCIIAQTCMETGAELLSPDADFTRIAAHTRLRLCAV